MTELNDESECVSAVHKIQNLVPYARYGGDLTMSGRPPGCFYHPSAYRTTVYWNNDKNGKTCGSCRSVCKGSIINSLYLTL